MSATAAARNAVLFSKNEIAIAARDWLCGAGAPFLGLKGSEVAGLRRLSLEEFEKQTKERAKYVKKTSRWAAAVGGPEVDLLRSMMTAAKQAVEASCQFGGAVEEWNDVREHLTEAEAAALDQARHKDGTAEFVDCLVRMHQARNFWKKGYSPCKQQGS